MTEAVGRGESFRRYAANVVIALLALALAWSFWSNAHWMQLCAGLAFFLFGMPRCRRIRALFQGDSTLERRVRRVDRHCPRP